MSGRDELAARRARQAGHPSAQEPAPQVATTAAPTYLDPATGAWQRDIGMTWLSREIARAVRDGSPLLVGCLQVDVPDQQPERPAPADEVLRVFGEVLRGGLRSYDVFVRCGQSEFVVALPGAQRSNAEGKFDGFSSAVSARAPGALVSVGLATLEPGELLRDVLNRAELDRSPDGRASTGDAWQEAMLNRSFAGRRTGRWEPSTAQIGPARRLVSDALVEWKRADVVDSAALVVSELVTNAVLHAGTEVTVTVELLHGAVLLTVTDESAALPRVRVAGMMDHGGRGLRLIEALTSEWGVIAEPRGGKTVWALLRT